MENYKIRTRINPIKDEISFNEEESIDELRIKYNNLQSKYFKILEENKTLTKTLSILTNNYENLIEEKDSLELEIKELKTDIQILEHSLDSLESKNEELDEEILSLKESNKILKNEIKEKGISSVIVKVYNLKDLLDLKQILENANISYHLQEI